MVSASSAVDEEVEDAGVAIIAMPKRSLRWMRRAPAAWARTSASPGMVALR